MNHKPALVARRMRTVTDYWLEFEKRVVRLVLIPGIWLGLLVLALLLVMTGELWSYIGIVLAIVATSNLLIGRMIRANPSALRTKALEFKDATHRKPALIEILDGDDLSRVRDAASVFYSSIGSSLLSFTDQRRRTRQHEVSDILQQNRPLSSPERVHVDSVRFEDIRASTVAAEMLPVDEELRDFINDSEVSRSLRGGTSYSGLESVRELRKRIVPLADQLTTTSSVSVGDMFEIYRSASNESVRTEAKVLLEKRVPLFRRLSESMQRRFLYMEGMEMGWSLKKAWFIDSSRINDVIRVFENGNKPVAFLSGARNGVRYSLMEVACESPSNAVVLINELTRDSTARKCVDTIFPRREKDSILKYIHAEHRSIINLETACRSIGRVPFAIVFRLRRLPVFTYDTFAKELTEPLKLHGAIFGGMMNRS